MSQFEWGVKLPDGEIEPAGVLGEHRARMLARKTRGQLVGRRNGGPWVFVDEPAPPLHTGSDWVVDTFVRRLCAELYQRGLIERPDVKAESRVTVALAAAWGTTNLGDLPGLVGGFVRAAEVEVVDTATAFDAVDLDAETKR